MKTYTIETTHGVLEVDGDSFGPHENELTGEFRGYEVTKDDTLAAYIPANTLVSVVVKA